MALFIHGGTALCMWVLGAFLLAPAGVAAAPRPG
jgi:hypothetical protein